MIFAQLTYRFILTYIFQFTFILLIINTIFEYKDCHSIHINSFSTVIFINIIAFILFTIYFFIKTQVENRKKMLGLMSTSGSLQEKNMKILTENVHHELNTPVAIIQGMIKQLEFKISSENKEYAAIRGNNSQVRSYNFNFDEVYAAVEQINTVLERMSNFKQFKYSNGNKTVLDIFKYSSNSMKIYKHSNFNIILSDELNNYSLSGSLGNGDLLNIISNHFRNSLEAKSTTIRVDCKFIQTFENKGILKLFIVDNGIGLRDKETGEILKSYRYSDVFKPYYSTKDIAGNNLVQTALPKWRKCINTAKKIFFPEDLEVTSELRGVGLFLNKQLLIENDSDVTLRETSEKGTVFELKIHASLKNNNRCLITNLTK